MLVIAQAFGLWAPLLAAVVLAIASNIVIEGLVGSSPIAQAAARVIVSLVAISLIPATAASAGNALGTRLGAAILLGGAW